MLIRESQWLKSVILSLDIKAGSNVLNFGSCNSAYTKMRPQIEMNIYNPTIAKNLVLLNFDLFPGEGIDIHGDILNDIVHSKLSSYNFSMIYLFNVLEHVEDIKSICDKIEQILQPGGYLLITVPYSFPPHDEPIDNGFRPLPNEVANLFKSCVIVKQNILSDYKYPHYLKRNINRIILSFFGKSTDTSPVYKPDNWKQPFYLLKYFFQCFKVTCLVLKKDN